MKPYIQIVWSLIFSVLVTEHAFPQNRAYQPKPLGSSQVNHDTPDSEKFKSIGITDKLGETVDVKNLEFKNEEGETVSLSKYFYQDKPVILNLLYFNCPSLCGLTLNGMTEALRRIDWQIGDEFTVLSISIDPSETPELAADKKQNYIKNYGRPGGAKGWHFLSGQEDQIKALAKQVGFGYRYVEETGEFAHSAGFFILTPEAKVSRVHYGVQFQPTDIRLSLVEASNGGIGSLMDKALLFCFRYDPNSKGYALHAFRLVQAGGILTVLALGTYLFIFWRKQKLLGELASKNKEGGES